MHSLNDHFKLKHQLKLLQYSDKTVAQKIWERVINVSCLFKQPEEIVGDIVEGDLKTVATK